MADGLWLIAGSEIRLTISVSYLRSALLLFQPLFGEFNGFHHRPGFIAGLVILKFGN